MVLQGYDDPTPDRPIRCGRYELLERIGYGGMAEVFKARLPGPAGFEKIVVIKRILPRLLDDQLVVRMFVEEARIAAAADHDNIAQVFELGQAEDGKFFMAMEYIRGVDLEVLLAGAAKRSLRVPAWFGVHAVAEVLEALSFVHGLVDESGRPRNVIHRDATPSNIFVSHRGQVKLSDFGVADFDGKSPTTRAGQLKGKLSYLSPEQLNGQMLDQRSDIFTIGIVLWEILTQQRLFGGLNEIQAMMAICEGKRTPPSGLVPWISPELDRVTLKALAINRDDRYRTAAEFQRELLDALHDMHRPVRHIDVQDVLQVLLGRSEPTSDLIARGTPDGSGRESSFLVPISDDLEGNLADTAAREPQAEEVTPKSIQRILFDPDENQDPTLSVEPEELRAIMSAHPPTADLQAIKTVNAHRFWLRGRAGRTSEALTWAEALSRMNGGGFSDGSISADELRWVPIDELASLIGDDRLVELHSDGSNVTTVGSLKERGVISLLGLHARDRSSGTLAFARTDGSDTEWYELQLYDGRPTRITTNVLQMQMPALLVNSGRVPGEALIPMLHAAVKERRPLGEIAAARGFGKFAEDEYLAHRLRALFEWRAADHTFTLDVKPSRLAPLTSSLLALLPPAVKNALTPERLRELFGPRLDARFEPSWRYFEALKELHLSTIAAEIANKLAAHATLRSLLDLYPASELLPLAYVLIEADLLVATID